MVIRSFEYHTPNSINEAHKLLSRYGEKSKVLAGGQSLIPIMKLGLSDFDHLIDLKRIKDLNHIRNTDRDTIAIGALAKHTEVEYSTILADGCPLLCETAKLIGHTQIRNKGTIGGSICHCDPSADILPSLVALDASLKAEGPSGTKTFRSEDFFKDVFSTALEPNDILTEIEVPITPKGAGYAYQKLSMGAGDFAIVGVSTTLELDSDGSCKTARVALGGVGEKPFRVSSAEKILTGRKVTAEVVDEAADQAVEESRPVSDLKASAQYKKLMVATYTRRALNAALSRANGR
ncbi:MAG: FAD binding domain-containing protein [Nitrososphaerales archaeon]